MRARVCDESCRVLTEDRDRSGVGREQAGHQPDGGLPRSTGTDQGHDPSLLHLEVEVEHARLFEALGEF